MGNKIGECKYCNRPVYDDEKYRIINLNGGKDDFSYILFQKIKKGSN